jgi:hypothetical protein
MHQSDYPHGEAHFPDTAQMVLDWPIWKDLGRDVLPPPCPQVGGCPQASQHPATKQDEF